MEICPRKGVLIDEVSKHQENPLTGGSGGGFHDLKGTK